MLDEREKQRLRDLKSRTVVELQSVRLSSYTCLDKADKRLAVYIDAVRFHPHLHNLYELLELKRFFHKLDRYEFRISEIRKFIKFYERLRFNGTKGVTLYRLTPIQVYQFANILAFYRTPVKRLCRTALLFVPRKFSKTTSVASLAIYDLLFGDNNAQAYVAANSYDQAQICFAEIKGILRNMDKKLRRFKINREQVFNLMPGKNSFARCLASSPDKLDGLNASINIVDEYSQADSSELKNVLTSSMGARVNPLTVIITTASDKMAAPFFEELQGYKKLLEGDYEDDSVFAHIFEPDVDDDESDEITWRKVQPHWGITVQEDYYAYEYQKGLRSFDDMKTFRTKLLNMYVPKTTKQWISSDEAYEHRKEVDIRKVEGGPLAMVAIDLSVHDDFSAISYNLYSETLKKFHIHTEYYIPETTLRDHPNKDMYQRWVDAGYMKVCQGDVIDYAMIVNDILQYSRYIRIAGIGYDPYKSQDCVNMLAASGFKKVLKPVPQTYGAFNAPVETFEYALRTDQLTIGDNPINWYCFGNAVLDQDRNENKKPVKKTENKKIDGAITSLMTFYMFNNLER